MPICIVSKSFERMNLRDRIALSIEELGEVVVRGGSRLYTKINTITWLISYSDHAVDAATPDMKPEIIHGSSLTIMRIREDAHPVTEQRIWFVMHALEIV